MFLYITTICSNIHLIRVNLSPTFFARTFKTQNVKKDQTAETNEAQWSWW